jgi:uncharacterized Zn finger protein
LEELDTQVRHTRFEVQVGQQLWQLELSELKSFNLGQAHSFVESELPSWQVRQLKMLLQVRQAA